MPRPATAALWLGLTIALSPTSALAYCFSAACGEGEQSTLCDGDALPRGGCAPLSWPSACMGYSVHTGGSRRVDAETAELITELAFDAWRVADCGGQRPGFVAQNLGFVECASVEYNKDAGNANVIVFRDDAWPHPDTGHNIALTTTTFDPNTGALLDADIELNSASYELSVSDDDVQFDLLSVLTHEIGHFLGLSHSDDAEATMFASYEPGTTELRTLEADDQLAICTLYPPTPGLDESCNPLPRHGFSPYCKGEQLEGDCSFGRSGGSPGALGVGMLLAAGLGLRRLRARASIRARASRPRHRRSP